MPRDSIRDFGPDERLAHQAKILGSPGVAGKSRVGGIGTRGGGAGATPPVVAGRGAHIEHVTLLATASQTIASGGASLGFDRIAGAPTEVRGFPTLLGNLTASGEVFAIPVDVRGWIQWQLLDMLLSVDIDAEFTVTQKRDGATVASETVHEAGGRGDVQWPWMYGEAKDTWTFTVDPDVAFDITRMLCDGFVIVDSPATSRPVLVETIWLDSKVGTVTSTATLEDGQAYTLRITGNYRIYNTGLIDEGTPDTIMYPSPGETADDFAILDADVRYGDADPGSFPQHATTTTIDTGSGASHVEARGGPYATPQAGHEYSFDVTGEGSTVTVAVSDSPLSDNNGQLKVEIFRGTV